MRSLLLLTIGVFICTGPAKADDILCERQPTAELVDQSITGSKKSENPCATANAKIQAIAYECGNVMDTYTKTKEFLREDIQQAKIKCNDFCKSVSPKCRGKFQSPPDCALSIPSTKALAVGREVAKCPKHCKGQAFTYCSLYHGNFFSYDSDQFKKFPANCFCERAQ